MNLATLLRFCKIPGENIWANRFYLVQAHLMMARDQGVGLNALTNDCDPVPICDQCAGLLVPGSATNIDPSYYGGEPFEKPEPVDEYALDSKLIDYFMKQGKPIFGVCGGLQALNVFLGGTLKKVPDVAQVHEHKARMAMPDGEEIDYPMHKIRIEKDSFVYEVFGAEEAVVNSYHFWCIDELAPGLRAVAWSEDGIIEAVEWREKKLFATQWHPELSYMIGDPVEHKFFENFIRCCR